MTGPRVASVVLAAGASTRMPNAHKLLESVDGRPIIRWVVDAAREAGTDPVVVVTGRGATEVEALLPRDVTIAHNQDFRDGLSTSLRCGIEALPHDVEAALIALGDMPFVRANHLRELIAEWRPHAIVVPVHAGRRGNPVLWSAAYFDEMRHLTGDRGARGLIEAHSDSVIEVPILDDVIFFDIDDRGDLERARNAG